jgi:hypothetical protein
MSHPHGQNDGDYHSKRPEWWNGISTGNVLTFAGFVVLAAVAWGGNEQKQAQQDKELDRTNERINMLETRIVELGTKAENMAVTQAVMYANIEMLVRAQGLRPYEAPTPKGR